MNEMNETACVSINVYFDPYWRTVDSRRSQDAAKNRPKVGKTRHGFGDTGPPPNEMKRHIVGASRFPISDSRLLSHWPAR